MYEVQSTRRGGQARSLCTRILVLIRIPTWYLVLCTSYKYLSLPHELS
jgi:hypothetical protein